MHERNLGQPVCGTTHNFSPTISCLVKNAGSRVTCTAQYSYHFPIFLHCFAMDVTPQRPGGGILPLAVLLCLGARVCMEVETKEPQAFQLIQFEHFFNIISINKAMNDVREVLLDGFHPFQKMNMIHYKACLYTYCLCSLSPNTGTAVPSQCIICSQTYKST